MTQIMDSNRFWGQKKFSKFLDFFSRFDSYICTVGGKIFVHLKYEILMLVSNYVFFQYCDTS